MNSNYFFMGLKSKGCMRDKKLKYFLYQYNKACNLGNLHLLPNIHKRLSEILGRPVKKICEPPIEKVTEFINSNLKALCKQVRLPGQSNKCLCF